MHFETSVIDGERRSMYVYSIGFTTAGVLMVYKKHDNIMKLFLCASFLVLCYIPRLLCRIVYLLWSSPPDE